VERAYRHSRRVLAALLLFVGLTLVVTTIARGGGPLAMGVVVGAALAVLGVGRAYLASSGGGRRSA
jgi:hypothetical protein